MSIFTRGLGAGIELAIETFNETNTEVTVMAITTQLNKMKWLGKSNWTDVYVQAYIDNLRGNLNSRIISGVMRSEVFKIHGTNYSIIKGRKIKDLFGKLFTKIETGGV